MNSENKHYDVALSFAGEDRVYVEQVAAALRSMGVSVFYDKYEMVSLWGKNLYTHLQEVYSHKASYTVIFISKHYKEKLWTNHERESAQVRAFTEKEECILPARFDDTQIPGIHSTIGYISLDGYRPEEFAELIGRKIGYQQDVENLSGMAGASSEVQSNYIDASFQNVSRSLRSRLEKSPILTGVFSVFILLLITAPLFFAIKYIYASRTASTNINSAPSPNPTSAITPVSSPTSQVSPMPSESPNPSLSPRDTASPVAVHTPNLTATKRSVFIMDSEANTISINQLVEILRPFTENQAIEISTEAIKKDSNVNDNIASKKPNLIIIHVSAFFTETNVKAADNYVMDFISAVGNKSPETKFLVYSGVFKDGREGEIWVNRVAQKYSTRIQGGEFVPPFVDNIETIWYPHATTIPESLKASIRNKVSHMLGISKI